MSAAGFYRRSATAPAEFSAVEWLQPDQVDEAYFDLLPSKTSEMTIEEIAELFGEDGELAAERLS